MLKPVLVLMFVSDFWLLSLLLSLPKEYKEQRPHFSSIAVDFEIVPDASSSSSCSPSACCSIIINHVKIRSLASF